MADIFRQLLIPALVVLGWYLSSRDSEFARVIARSLLGVLLIFLVILAFAAGQYAGFHRWGGHALLIAVWLMAPFCAGVLLQRHFNKKPFTACFEVLVLIMLVASTLLANMSGYLKQPDQPNLFPNTPEGLAAEEAQNRFIVLHQYFFPGIVAILLIVCVWFFRPKRRSEAEA